MRHLFFSHAALGFSLGVVSLTIIIALLGFALVLLSATLLKEPGESAEHPLKEFFHHMVRDIGLAFLVAAIVTLVYGSTLDFHRVSDAISLMIGEDIPQSVWDTTKAEVFQRDVFRGNYDAVWTIQPDDSLPPNEARLNVHLEYTLYGLKSQPFPFIVKQELENIHLKNADGTLPRFDSVTIVGGKTYQGDELQQRVKNGLLTLDPITLGAWKKTDARFELTENPGVRIIFERSEIIHIPGEYSVVLSQLTKNIKLRVEHPDNIRHELKEWFDPRVEGFQPAAGGRYYTMDGVVLPGQSVSVQFWRKDDEQPPSPAPTPTPPVKNSGPR